MRLRILLPKVNPEAITVPIRCAYVGCRGRKFYLRQEVAKPLRDTVYHEVQVHRYQCLKCKRALEAPQKGPRAVFRPCWLLALGLSTQIYTCLDQTNSSTLHMGTSGYAGCHS